MPVVYDETDKPSGGVVYDTPEDKTPPASSKKGAAARLAFGLVNPATTIINLLRFSESQPDERAPIESRIAASPATRFAVGAAEPTIGMVQRLGEAKLGKTMLPNPLSLLSTMASYAAPVLTDSLHGYEALKKEGGATGTDVFGTAGTVMSPQSMMLTKVPTPAKYLGKVSAGGVAGFAGGSAAPADSEEQARLNALYGLALGAAVPAVATPVANAAQLGMNTFVDPVVDLFKKSGPANIINRYIRGSKVVGEQNMPVVLNAIRNVDEVVPGMKPTVAEAMSGVPEGSPLAALQDISSKTGGGPSGAFGQRLIDQQNAINAAKAARDAMAVAPRETAIRAANYAGGVETAPILKFIKSEALKPQNAASTVVSRGLNEIGGKIASLTDDTGRIDAAAAYTIRKEIGKTLQSIAEKENIKFDSGMAAKIEREIQLAIDSGMNNAIRLSGVRDVAPGVTVWDRYLSNFSKASQDIRTAATRAEQALTPPQKTNLGGGINITEETRPHLPNLLSRPAMAVNWMMRKAGSGVEPKVDAALAEIMLDPSKFDQIMSKLPKQTQLQVEEIIRGANALSFGAAANQ